MLGVKVPNAPELLALGEGETEAAADGVLSAVTVRAEVGVTDSEGLMVMPALPVAWRRGEGVKAAEAVAGAEALPRADTVPCTRVAVGGTGDGVAVILGVLVEVSVRVLRGGLGVPVGDTVRVPFPPLSPVEVMEGEGEADWGAEGLK